jgi:DNA-binding MarR family transcriptional regulator
LREILHCADSPLSKAISHLESAGYVHARKDRLGARPRTWVRSTPQGRAAFSAHLQALREIVALGGEHVL